MSGHSKWSTIKRKKGANDSKRAQVFTKLIRELVSATRQGGADPSMNSRLRLAILKAKDANMPGDTLDKAIKRGAGDSDADNFEEMLYEGYGPSGVGIIAEVLTDNKNRTAADVRHIFNKCGGSLGAPGSVAYNFERIGQFFISKEAIQEDALMEHVLESGAEDLITDDEEFFEIVCSTENFYTVKDYLDKQGLKLEEAAIIRKPKTRVMLSGDDLKKMLKFINMVDDNDDIQEIYHNFDCDEAEMNQIMESI